MTDTDKPGIVSALPMLFDHYTRNARLIPSLLVLLPAVVAVFVTLPTLQNLLGGLVSVAVYCGAGRLLAEIGREQGKRKETELFTLWGGTPTTRMLRHRDAPNAVTLARIHRKLAAITEEPLPSAGDERSDPTRADAAYEAAVKVLRERSRDRVEFPLVFKENVSYGFRRNLWGMKPIGLAVSLGSAVACGWATWRTWPQDATAAIAGAVVAVLFLVFWIMVATPDWVRTPAEAYAERLLDCVERLEPPVQRHSLIEPN